MSSPQMMTMFGLAACWARASPAPSARRASPAASAGSGERRANRHNLGIVFSSRGSAVRRDSPAPRVAVHTTLGAWDLGLTRKGGWCERGELNPHGLPHWILSPARLPVPPLSRASDSRLYHAVHGTDRVCS